jgi:hypothetical protein
MREKYDNGEYYIMRSFIICIRTLISRRKMWVGHVAYMRDRTESYKLSVGKFEGTWKHTHKRRILLKGSSRNKV